MPLVLRPFAGARCALAATLLVLLGCATERERTAWDGLDALQGSFQARASEVATLTSASGLEDYLALALQRNPSLQAQAQRWRADLERVPQARTLANPFFTYGVFLEPVETRTGPQRHRFGITQSFPWPGKLSEASGMALEEAEASRARTDAVRLGLRHQVTRAYADYYFLAREREVTRETLSLLRHWESVAQTRFRTGAPAAHRDVIKAQVEIGRLEDRLATLTEAGRPRAERLRALLNLPAEVALPWPSQLPSRALRTSDEELLALGTTRSPLLEELSRRVAARERGVALAQQSYLPEFMLGFEFVEVGPASRGAGGLRARGSGDDASLAKFGLSLPLWFGSNGAKVSEARARLRAAEFEREDAENALRAGLSRTLFDFHDAERKLSLYQDSLVPKAEQSLQATAAAFESGQGDFLDLLDAERVLLEFHLAHERALADRVTSFSELELLSGAELNPSR